MLKARTKQLATTDHAPRRGFVEHDVPIVVLPDSCSDSVVHFLQVLLARDTGQEQRRIFVEVPCKRFVHHVEADYAGCILELLSCVRPEGHEVVEHAVAVVEDVLVRRDGRFCQDVCAIPLCLPARLTAAGRVAL
eukprot:1712005-Prymnesium_polylepis.2